MRSRISGLLGHQRKNEIVSEDSVTFENQQQLEAFLAKLSPANFVKAINRAAVKIAEQIKNRLAPYPGPPSHPLKWASRKQRAWYFAMRRAAGLPDEYTRTSDPMSQKLGQSWAVQERPDGAILGSRADYADRVQSEERQTAMHAATGWTTDVKAVEEVEASGIIGRIIEAEIADLLKGFV